MLSRRTVLNGGLAFLAGAGISGYAVAEPWRLGVTRYRIKPAGWPEGLRLKVAALADIHACDPWMTVDRIAGIVERTNALKPDVVTLLGDYVNSIRLPTREIGDNEWAGVLGHLQAPLGVHAVLGNHDWWDDPVAQREDGRVRPSAQLALEKAGIPVYENNGVRLLKGGRPFWLLGLADQLALKRDRSRGRSRAIGRHDLAATMRTITDDAPAILMAHEPDIFPRVPDRISLTLSGHTHGGQIRVMGYAPVVPSRYGRRYSYGHVVEGRKEIIVSGGLGCSTVPVRLGVPPEIVLIEIGEGPQAAV